MSLAPVTLLLRKVRSAGRIPFGVLALAAVAWGGLWLARGAINTAPLRYLSRLYGVDHGVASCLPLATEAELRRAARIRRAVRLAVRYSPASANCYPQALVARGLLVCARVPHALFFGLRRETGGMTAHAWVMVAGLPVSGGDGFADHTVVRCYLGVP